MNYMARKKGSVSKKGILIFTSPSSQGHKVIERWNEYRLIESEELHSSPIRDEEEVKTNLETKAVVEKAAGVGFAGLSAASIQGYH